MEKSKSPDLSRREFLKKSAIMGGAVLTGGGILSQPATSERSEPASGASKVNTSNDERSAKPQAETQQAESLVSTESISYGEIKWLPEPVKELWPIIEEESAAFGLDPRLVAIIITEESGGLNVANTEGSGAYGPMQLMPIAMQEYARLENGRNPRSITDVRDNIHVGCWLIDLVNQNYIQKSGVDLYSDMGITMLAVGYGDGVGALQSWQRGGMHPGQLSQQAKEVSALWVSMWHERNQDSSPTLNNKRGYNT